jgi:DNA-binding NtrC family response regulator
VRFLAATNRDLETEIARGTFRQDLYFRLNGIALVIPPLRQRTSEILALAEAFLAVACERANRTPVPTIANDALACLRAYQWPGNIRELRNVVERALLLCTDKTIRLEHLPVEKMRDGHIAPSAAAAAPAPMPTPAPVPTLPPLPSPPSELQTIEPPPRVRDLDRTMDRSGDRPHKQDRREREREERGRIVEALARSAGNQTEAAKLLGMSRRTLINRVIAYGIPRPRKS